MSPPLAHAPWSLFLKAMRPSIRAGTRGFLESASWWGRNLEQRIQSIAITLEEWEINLEAGV